jgi:hypothetical protein
MFGGVFKLCDASFVTLNFVNALSLRTRKRKCLIPYYKTYGIRTLRKHVDAQPCFMDIK